MREIEDLIEISQFYGKNKDFVVAGGGNTSFKNEEKIWIKASGYPLSTINEEGFVTLDRNKLRKLSEHIYSQNFAEREEQVKNDLNAACLIANKRPSVETPMHNIINYNYVVHLHPTLVNGLMCSMDVEKALVRLFGIKSIYIPYTDPGYTLFKKVESELLNYRNIFHCEPSVIWLQNHGIFVAANSISEIKHTYEQILNIINKEIDDAGIIFPITTNTELTPALKNILTEGSKKIKNRNNVLISHFFRNPLKFNDVAVPFTPDAIVYCKSNYIYLEGSTIEILERNAEESIRKFREKHQYHPRVLLIENIGLFAIGDTEEQCDIILDVFEDAMKIAFYSHSFGGPHPMTKEQINFIDNWEVENYRRSITI